MPTGFPSSDVHDPDAGDGHAFGSAELRTVRAVRRAGVLWLVLDRPDALNSVSHEMVREIHAVLDQVEADPEVRCLVVTGAGRAFCAGSDLKAARRAGVADPAAASAAFVQAAAGLLGRIERLPLPVIAAVNGLALAGGLELVLCCDLVVAAAEAHFGDAHARLGLLPGWGASVRLPRRIGVARAKELMFTAAQVSAERMHQWGLVNRVVLRTDLRTAVDVLAAQLTDKSPLGLRRMKQLVDDGLAQPLEVALRHEQIMGQAHFHSADRQEGIAAFAEKRTPVFTGR